MEELACIMKNYEKSFIVHSISSILSCSWITSWSIAEISSSVHWIKLCNFLSNFSRGLTIIENDFLNMFEIIEYYLQVLPYDYTWFNINIVTSVKFIPCMNCFPNDATNWLYLHHPIGQFFFNFFFNISFRQSFVISPFLGWQTNLGTEMRLTNNRRANRSL